ncbi:MAG: hypothetical protein ABIA04_16370 [Pseudomonadota bacterium]
MKLIKVMLLFLFLNLLFFHLYANEEIKEIEIYVDRAPTSSHSYGELMLRFEDFMDSNSEYKDRVEVLGFELFKGYYNKNYYLFDFENKTEKESLPNPFENDGNMLYEKENIPYLSNWDGIIFQYPRTNFDLLEQIKESSVFGKTKESVLYRSREGIIQKKTGSIVSLKSSLGKKMDAFKVDTSKQKDNRWHLIFGFRYKLKIDSQEVVLVGLVKDFGSLIRRVTFYKNLNKNLKEKLILFPGSAIVDFDDHPFNTENLLQIYEKMGVDVINVNYHELKYAKDKIIEYGKTKDPLKIQFISSNIFKNTTNSEKDYLFTPYAIKEINGIKVGVIGLADDRSYAWLENNERDDLIFMEYEEAIKKVISQIIDKVDFIVLLSRLRNEVNAKFTHISGLDFILSNMEWPFSPVSERSLKVSKDHFRFNKLIGITSHSEIEKLSIKLIKENDKFRPIEIVEQNIMLDDSISLDEEAEPLREEAWAEMLDLKEVLIQDQKMIFPKKNSKDSVDNKLTDDNLTNFVARVMLESSDSELVVTTKKFRSNFRSMPGPLYRRYFDEWLSDKEYIVLIELSGKDLLNFNEELKIEADKQLGVGTLMLGLDDFGRINGRKVTLGEYYTISVDSFLLNNPEKFPTLKNAINIRDNFNNTRSGLKVSSKGQKVLIKDMVIDYLKKLNEKYEGKSEKELFKALDKPFRNTYKEISKEAKTTDDKELALLKTRLDSEVELIKKELVEKVNEDYYKHLQNLFSVPSPTPKGNFRINVKELSLSIMNNDMINNTDFTEVSNSRVAGTDQLLIGGGLDSALEYDYIDFNWDTELTADLQRITVQVPGSDSITQDIEDEILLQTELSYKTLKYSQNWFSHDIGPFGNISYETEFTPEDGLPRVSLFDVILGGKIFSGNYLQSFKLGGLMETDFAQDNNIEYGIYSKLEFMYPLPAGSVWLSESIMKYFFPSSSDTADDLGLELGLSNKFLVPILRDLSLGPYADIFMYTGKEVDAFGASVIIGLTLSYSKIWKPAYQRLF